MIKRMRRINRVHFVGIGGFRNVGHRGSDVEPGL